MSRKLVGDDDGVSGPCRAGDGGTSGIGCSIIPNVFGVIRGGRGRQLAVADFGPRVGVVAGQAAGS